MPARLVLPAKGDDKLIQALNRMVEEGERVRNIRAVKWWTVYWYLNGARNFDTLNFRDGTVKVSFPNTKGMPFIYEEIVTKYRTEVGQLMRLDTTPKVDQRAATLDSLRRVSVARVVLNSVVPRNVAERLKLELMQLLVAYGMGALSTWVDPATTGREAEGVVPEIEIIPPWELLSIPAAPPLSSATSGVMRARWVAKSWLESLGLGAKLVPGAKYTHRSVAYGQTPTTSSSTAPSSVTTADSRGDEPAFGDGGGPSDQEYVKIIETWVYGAHNRLSRYIIHSGDLILKDDSYDSTADPPYIPIHIARFVDAGGFYGRGEIELLIPLAAEQEQMFQNLAQNVSELDAFGFLALPLSLGIQPSQIRSSDRPRIIQYQPDYTVPDAKPFNIAPTNAGTLPGEVAKIFLALNDRIAPQSELLSGNAPGRVDSARALGLLYETSTVPLTAPAGSIAAAFSGVYSSLLSLIRKLWPSPKIAAIATSDDSLAGVVINPETGALDREKNSIPQPDEVDVGILSKLPDSPEQQKMELYDALRAGLINPRWFRIEARKRGLNLPLANDAEWFNFQRAMYNNILVFNDGLTPGRALLNENDMHEIHIEVILAFMARPEFTLASVGVRRAFEDLLREHRAMLGNYPEPISYAEDAAAQNADLLSQQDQMQALSGGDPLAALSSTPGMVPGQGGAMGLPPA